MKHNIYKLILLSFVCVGGFNSQSSAMEEKETKKLLRTEIKTIDFKGRAFRGDLKLFQRADSWESKLENSFRYTFYAETDLNLRLSNVIFIDIWAGLGTTLGSVQSRFGDLRTGSAIRLRDSRIFYRDSWQDRKHWAKLSFGAIGQREFLNNAALSMLMSRRALPGLEQIYKYENVFKDEKSYGFDIRFFEGVPTSESLNLDFNEREDTPFYYNGKLELFYKDMDPDFGYRFGLHAGIYDFSELPSVVADESRLFGNTVNGIGGASSFEYDYKGWYAGWSAVLSIKKKWEIKPFIDILTNTEAPSGRNQAQTYGAILRYHKGNNYSLGLEPYAFFNESDASVASYNGSTAGHNNREGYGMNLALEMPRKGLKLKLSYAYSDVLEENGDLQVPFHSVGLKMEYKYEL